MSNTAAPYFSICIPAYNRVEYLIPLLESIATQEFQDYEVIVCEDLSPQRNEIRAEFDNFVSSRALKNFRLEENKENLGYDGNLRRLVELCSGKFVFFMGNDDLLAEDALSLASAALKANPSAGMLLRSYSWFKNSPTSVEDTVRFFDDVRLFRAGEEAIRVGYRRSGVISAFVVDSTIAKRCATNMFDGGLYYQMHLCISVLWERDLVNCPNVLVYMRDGVPPDFGRNVAEKGHFSPGKYTQSARLKMISSVISIAEHFDQTHNTKFLPFILKDYSNYFYPYIRDQLTLPLKDYLKLCFGFYKMGFSRFPMFYLYCFICYIFGKRNFDRLVKYLRAALGRSPNFGMPKGESTKPT
jgi:abequosyltransferase